MHKAEMRVPLFSARLSTNKKLTKMQHTLLHAAASKGASIGPTAISNTSFQVEPQPSNHTLQTGQMDLLQLGSSLPWPDLKLYRRENKGWAKRDPHLIHKSLECYRVKASSAQVAMTQGANGMS